MSLTLIQADKSHLPYIKMLYKTAFPKEERRPFFMLVQQAKHKKIDIWILHQDNTMGFVTCIPYQDLLLVDYLAVDPKARGLGLGSQALQLLTKQYSDKKIFLEIEAVEASAENYTQRVRRKDFYLRNGFTETGIDVLVFGVHMELLSYQAPISFTEYRNVYSQILPRATMKNIQQA